ncbi:hypothetical protein [Plebeiibacterium marinum]|uniref:Uncharacterized protein n=1 Tax=Plebeiibacterium marinum TaxID=2992111 RepID=A0AAE3SK60_9BACT|nr:hypothetical protein [Plebeiobacterium marinum]MCW3806183.1 hypothetical protein [Plebeiobacterium marinum]
MKWELKNCNDSSSYTLNKYVNGHLNTIWEAKNDMMHGNVTEYRNGIISITAYKKNTPQKRMESDSLTKRVYAKYKMLNDSIFQKKTYGVNRGKIYKGHFKIPELLKDFHFSGQPIGYWEEPDSTGMFILKGYYSDKIFQDTVEIYNTETNRYDERIIFYTKRIGNWIKTDLHSNIVDTLVYRRNN